MRYRYLFCIFSLIFLLTGCSLSVFQSPKTTDDPSDLFVGNLLEIKNTNSRLILLDHKETLAADGLYYLSWGMNPNESEESSGEDLASYDVQLYLLLGEAANNEEAKLNMDTWITAAQTNYEIIEEKEISCNECSYSVIRYNRNSAENGYTKGISAFGTLEQIAICVELISTENFQEDLESILIEFLNNCFYQI